MAINTPQRSYRAACPGCGAPVEFRSAQSTHAVCSFCQSTVVRDGDTLARLGKMAELFDDHSPLQLLATGRWQDRPFTLVGRLQYQSGSGRWTEWNALFDDGGNGWLGEDNGAYVFSVPASLQPGVQPEPTRPETTGSGTPGTPAGRAVPAAHQFRVGATTAIDGTSFDVASNEQAALLSAQGELPKLPPLGQNFDMVELRSADGELLSIDYSTLPPSLTRGRAVRLDELALAGLKEVSIREEQGRSFACPNCAAPVAVTLTASKSITCRACNSLIDLTTNVGGELRHALQDEPIEPLIALGSSGQLQGLSWQVVGFMHRMGSEPGAEDDERFGWSEYLLYNRKRGFMFLVDSEDGWSIVKPVTGAPALSAGGQGASYLGTRYTLVSSYEAETVYVAGEFYWPVERGQKTSNSDFASGASLLSMERTPREITWSSGSKIDSDAVAKIFNLEQKKELLERADAGPTSGGGSGGIFMGLGCGTLIVWFIILVVLLLVIRSCILSFSTEGGARSGGGSYGGYSSGGGHK